jgi:hypothetical protein
MLLGVPLIATVKVRVAVAGAVAKWAYKFRSVPPRAARIFVRPLLVLDVAAIGLHAHSQAVAGGTYPTTVGRVAIQ